MQPDRFTFETTFVFPREDVFSYHLAPKALDRMIPPFVKATVLERGSPMDVGSLARVKVYLGPFYRTWVAKHTFFCHDVEFCDEQIEGPFSLFKHQHIFSDADKGCLLQDKIECKAPFYLPKSYVLSQLKRMFFFRHKRVEQDLTVIERYSLKAQRILISGSSGLVGSALSAFLEVAGHRVFTLKRGESDPSKNIVGWDPSIDGSRIDDFEGFDAVIHLSGENIAANAWTPEQKHKIFQSRSRDTWHLSQILSRTKTPPRVFISASAVGIYGDRGAEPLSEESTLGGDFLSEVCVHWESATESLKKLGVRVCHARFGYILSPRGGMLHKMLLPFRLGLGGRLGDGTQYMPWVALDDVVYSLYHLMMREDLKGAFNICAPKAVEQKEFARTLSHHLRRPCFCHAPKALLKLLLKERAEALLLRSANVVPMRLLQSGYEFVYQDLESYFISSI